MEKLKACPFCGQIPEFPIQCNQGRFGSYRLLHYCSADKMDCIEIHSATEQGVLTAWNRRQAEKE